MFAALTLFEPRRRGGNTERWSLAGLALTAAPGDAWRARQERDRRMPDHSAVAELIALGFMLVVTVVLVVLHDKVAIARKAVSYTPAGGVEQRVVAGAIIP